MLLSKRLVQDLAIFGGQPSFAEPLHVGRPNIPDRGKLLDRISDIIDRRWLSNNGPMLQELEHRIEAQLGVRNCVAICNGTVALEIAIRAAGLNGEVIVPSYTFVATAHALKWQEITPIFCDVDPNTHNLDPVAVEKCITPRTTGILAVHVWGRPCDIVALTKIAQEYNLKLLFDASHAFGCTYQKNYIGNFGLAEIFSFHATKFFNTFEGGAIVTNDDDFAEKLRLMRNFGFAGQDNVIYLGTNGKMNEVSAAMGLGGLEQLQDVIDINHTNYDAYRFNIKDIPGVSIITYDHEEQNNFQYIIIEIDEKTTGISRDHVWSILQAEKIMVRRYFFPGCHQMEPYKTLWPNARETLIETERLTQRVLCLPTGTAVTTETIKQICDLLRFSIVHADQVVSAWQH